VRDTAQEFKAFIMRGNVIDLAIAVVIGAAFGAVVTALVTGVLTPLIAAIFGEPNFADIGFDINDSRIQVGLVLNALIAFLTVAFVLFFFVVKPMNMLIERSKRNAVPADPTSKKCPYCLSEVPLEASRCAFCTSELNAAAA
jgi:large conductance mechanosensitive channel